jgi:Ni/Fe-hydrogenase subunit HybB-like protein
MTTDPAAASIGYARQEPTKPAPWHSLVAWDLFFNGLTTGLFLVAALTELAAPETFAPVSKVAYPLALLFLLIDLTLLTLDLGDPSRFHHMLRMFKPRSPMSLGVWSLTVYSLPLTVAVLLDLFAGGAGMEIVRKVAVVVAIVPALASAVYKGVLLSTSAQPAWRDARWLGGYLAYKAFVLGCAVMVVLAFLAGQTHAARVLRPAFGILLAVQAVPLVLLAVELWPAARRGVTAGQCGFILLALVIGGMLLPLVFVIVGDGPAPLITAAVLVLLGSLATRFLLVRLPH